MSEESVEKVATGHDTTGQPPVDASNTPRLRPQSEALHALGESIPNPPSPNNAKTGAGTDAINEPLIVRMVNAIITQAIEKGASDIHIEPERESFIVRGRIDGTLQQVMRVPKHVQVPTINRYKVMADIPFWLPAPQTGFIPIRHDDHDYNLVVSTSPTPSGDHLKMRLLKESMPHQELQHLGMDAATKEKLTYDSFYGGLILLVGPAGAARRPLPTR